MIETSFGEMPLSRKGRREISDFIAKELLYDYMAGRLDGDRQAAVEAQLSKNKELKAELDRIHLASSYAKKLASTQIQLNVINQIDEPETYLSVLLKKTNFQKWPLGVRWAVEAYLVLMVLMILLIAVPWEDALKFSLSPRSREIILAEAVHETSKDREALKARLESEKGNFEDEGVKKPETIAPVAVQPASPSKPPENSPLIAAAPLVKTETPSSPTPPPPVAAGKAPVKEREPIAEAKQKKASEGFLYRGVLAVTNLSMTSPKIVEKILALGGRKAGEVDLGWKKTPTSSYFHFTIPEAKYEELSKFLSDYGRVKIAKEKHPRIMPDGIVRLILTVEEARSSAPSTPSEEP